MSIRQYSVGTYTLSLFCELFYLWKVKISICCHSRGSTRTSHAPPISVFVHIDSLQFGALWWVDINYFGYHCFWGSNNSLHEMIVIDGIGINNQKRRLVLHHDNGSSHTRHQTIDYLMENNIELVPIGCIHLIYRQQLFCSPMFIKQYRDNHWSHQEAVKVRQIHVSEKLISDWRKCCQNWYERIQKCINLIDI